MGFYEVEFDELTRQIKALKEVHLDPAEHARREFELRVQRKKIADAILLHRGKALKDGEYRRVLKRSGLVGDSLVVVSTVEEVEKEKVMCDSLKKILTRRECLSRTSDSKYFETCKSLKCPYYESTRDLLLGELAGTHFDAK